MYEILWNIHKCNTVWQENELRAYFTSYNHKKYVCVTAVYQPTVPLEFHRNVFEDKNLILIWIYFTSKILKIRILYV
jgi:hypothetical protein